MSEGRTLQIEQTNTIAEGVVELVLVDRSGAKLNEWSAGAHIDLVLPSGLVRQYSLCGDPSDLRSYRIAVLKEPNGRGGSTEIHANLHVGMPILTRGPRNHFELVEADDYILIAGGIGVTPIMVMALELVRRRKPWVLHYGGRTIRSMAYLNELRALSGEFTHFVPQDECGLLNLDLIFSQATQETAVYCCGPEALLTAVLARADRLSSADLLHIERFSAPAAEPTSIGENAAFEVELQRSGITLIVPPSKSLLDVIKEFTPDVMYACEEGYCGSCEATVLEGIPDHRDSFLSKSEKERGKTMMLCVGRSLTPKLVLDL
ncbi:PDR/VanB family oxidoreductase [Mesorhizobium sp. DCY119]|uniref:PDR/VanB family oxidoreductase n=1 Tax=Mesorhizobium sp. DCY119 TaxID=2108445 RepID=UPI000E76FB5C|nr:PDR/VanB family oxidoreductase [Mesorhizobium sp. DCY119]RJG40464.1 oxidoreductase [Mesorhizobium sp. DCY119]